jgi:hypothetical protein
MHYIYMNNKCENCESSIITKVAQYNKLQEYWTTNIKLVAISADKKC